MLEEAELVEKATECADGRVAVLTNERLLSVKDLGSASSIPDISEVRLDALGISWESVARLSCAAAPVIRLKSGETIVYSPDDVPVACGAGEASGPRIFRGPAETLHFLVEEQRSIILNASGVFECTFANTSTKTGKDEKRLALSASGGYADIELFGNALYAAGDGFVEVLKNTADTTSIKI